MRLEVSLAQKLSLQLKLAPQIIQSIEILQLPALSLQELVETALHENEALERDDESPSDVEEATPAAPASENGRDDVDREEMDAISDTLEKLEQLERAADRDWQDFGRRRSGFGEEDAKFEAMNNTAASTASLHETLYDQFILLDPTEDERTLGRHIIFNLN